MAIAINGTPGHANASATTVAAAVTTTSAALIVAVVTTNGGPITGVSGGGLSWARHANVTGGSAEYLELWTAEAASPLSAVTMTATNTFSSFCTLDVFGVSGYDTADIFDNDASVPNTGVSDPRTISTALADTMIIGAFRFAGTPSPTAGSGYTAISGADYQLTEYQVVSSTQSGLSVTVGTGVGNANGGIATAIRAAAGGGGGISIPVVVHHLRNQGIL